MSTQRKPGPKGKQRARYAGRRRVPWPVVIGLAAVLVLAFFIVRSLDIGAPGERIAVAGVGQHVPEGQAVQYTAVPPVGGAHWPSPASWGTYPAQLPDERVVHNLEHGGIVIDYNGIPADDVRKLQSLLLSYPRDRYNEVKLVIQPYNKIAPGTVALTAWGWRELLSAYDEQAIRAFLDAHMNRCCESVP